MNTLKYMIAMPISWAVAILTALIGVKPFIAGFICGVVYIKLVEMLGSKD